MIGKIKMMAIITFYVAVLLVIAVYLQDGSGTFSHFFENANLYIRNLRNVHAPAFHQTYDNYLQLFPLIFCEAQSDSTLKPELSRFSVIVSFTASRNC